MGEIEDVGTEIYRLRSIVCPPQLAVSVVSMWLQLLLLQLHLFCFVSVGVCVCVSYMEVFFSDSEERPSTAAGAICGTSLPVLLIGPVTVLLFFLNLKGKAERGGRWGEATFEAQPRGPE